ncbi:conserved hypothetical protein [Methanolacinia petrolearia DSM 11571]|uniref:Uncharacterized protein n=1 Tax=Methanolacinia petrolearia (strain DSM 11571 / OCM 486 / SEBR 4847) TaxID=679926 RepID=E1RHR7_METP4|nr:hypothetical protein [Methanolacinia petrolearia]ADN36455.1 conserved hypothetical protein [Methanolacinia petrolearia DSM 11571]
MIKKAGVIWDCDCYINKYICDNDIGGEIITPQMLATPFYKGRLVAVLIPTGFGNPAYSGLMPALKATSGRIRKFVEKGGRALVFGAMYEKEGCYDWLPFKVKYTHEYFNSPVITKGDSDYCGIVKDFNENGIECDGYFPEYEGECIAETADGRCIMIEKKMGDGFFIVTSIHEFPSRDFLTGICSGDSEIIF